MVRIAVACALAFASAAIAAPLAAQDYPARPVRVLVGFAAGSGPDIQARTVAQALARAFGQSFVVENRPGANGTVAARAVATAEGDGTTLLFSSASIASTPFLYRSLGYDVLRDLTPVATVGLLDGLFVLVRAASPLRSVADLIARAKQERVLYGSPGVGNGLHLATELFAQRAGITLQHIPYKGTTEVITALLSGSVDVMFVTTPAVIGLIKQGTVRPLAFTGRRPFPEFPDVPLMQQTLGGYPSDLSWGMFLAPAKTPAAIIDRLNAAIHAAILEPEVARIMQRDGYFPDRRNAAETAAFFRQEVERTGEMVKAAGIEAN